MTSYYRPEKPNSEIEQAVDNLRKLAEIRRFLGDPWVRVEVPPPSVRPNPKKDRST